MSVPYSKHDRRIIRVLNKVGLVEAKKVTETLQGSIWRATSQSQSSLGCRETESVVIKVTNQYLQKNSLAQIGNQQIPVQEDILLESSILKFLTENEKCPKSIVKFRRFFKTSVYVLLSI